MRNAKLFQGGKSVGTVKNGKNGNVLDERGAAPVLLFLCSDHRTTRSRDVAVIEQAVDRLAVRHNIVARGEEVEFDGIRVPGPQRGLAEGDAAEKKTLNFYSDILLDMHGVELVILGFHVGEGEESGCGREGEKHSDHDHVIANARRAVATLRAWFPNHEYEILMIGVRNGRTDWAREVPLEPRVVADRVPVALLTEVAGQGYPGSRPCLLESPLGQDKPS